MLTIWCCPCVELSHVLLERVFAVTSVFFWQNSVSLCHASFCTPSPNFPVAPSISWLPTFVFQSSIMKRTSFFGVSSRRYWESSQKTIVLQLLQHWWLGHRLGLLWCWLVCLGNKLKSYCCFWDCTEVLHFGLFCWLWGLLHFLDSKGFLPTVVDIMVFWIKFTFLLIPQMSMFILAISCLTSSSLPWFMDLTFQVPIQYCQYRTLLSLPDMSTTGCCFCFGSTSSFFLELFLCSSQVAYWTPIVLGAYLPVPCLFAFSYCSWGSQGKNTEVVCRFLLQQATFCQNSPAWPVSLVCLCMVWLIISLSYKMLGSMVSFWLVFCHCGFCSGGHGTVVLASSVCLLINKDKKLVQASWWEGLAVGKTGSYSGGQGHAQ